MSLSIVFLLLLVIALGVSGIYILEISQSNVLIDEATQPPDHHVSLFIPLTQSLLFSEIILGARDAAQERNIALSVHPIGQGQPHFTMAQHTGIHGAIVYPDLPLTETRTILDNLLRRGIPSVLVEHAVLDDAPWPYVGTNNFDLGRIVGQTLAQSLRQSNQDQITVAVVYSDKSPGIYAEKDLVEMGISTTLGRQLRGPIIRLRTDLNPLRAEELMLHLLRNRPDIQGIVFTDVNDTLAAAQVLIDLNMVGAVEMIGFGFEDPIPDYLDKGILTGSIGVNARNIGYQAMAMIQNLITDGFTSAFVDTGVEMFLGRTD